VSQPDSWRRRRYSPLAVGALLLLATATPTVARSGSPGAEVSRWDQPRNVLLLHAYPRLSPAVVSVDEAFREMLAAASPFPVYFYTEYLDLQDQAVGTGVVGGHVVSFETHGRTAGGLALCVLRGEEPPPIDAGTTVAMIDWRQLQRWRLDARQLPAGSVVLFPEPSLWEGLAVGPKANSGGSAPVRRLDSGMVSMEAIHRPVGWSPMVCVVDDDDSLLRALRRLLDATGFRVETFSSAEEFLGSEHRARADCLVLDVHLGGLSGLDLQERLATSGVRTPVVIITAHDDRRTRNGLSGPGPSNT